MSARIFTSSGRALRLTPSATSQHLFRRTITQTRGLGLKETASSMFYRLSSPFRTYITKSQAPSHPQSSYILSFTPCLASQLVC